MASSTLGKKDNQWSAYVLHKLNNPPVCQAEPVRRESFEKCPEYFSDEINGCVATKILAIDTTCKVTKWMIIYLTYKKLV